MRWFGRRGRAADPAGRSGAKRAPANPVELVSAADRCRDAGEYGKAAELYRAAFDLAPSRTDLRVQYGNMLKECGRLPEAESAYRAALDAAPQDGDIHLQLGHALKLQGRIADAADSYRRAAALLPASPEPLRELAQLGDCTAQQALFDAQLRLGGVEALATLTRQLHEMRATLDRMLAALPAIETQMAVPLADYDAFRKLYRVPAPPSVSGPRFDIVLLADGEEPGRLRRQIAAIERQAYPPWTLSIVVSEPAPRRVAEEAAARERRIAIVPLAPREPPHEAERRAALAGDADWIVLPAPGACLDPQALAWFAAAAVRTGAPAFFCDEDRIAGDGAALRYAAPQLRQAADYDALLEANRLGDTIAVRRKVYAGQAAGLAADSVSMARSLLLLSLTRSGPIGHVPLPLVSRLDEAAADDQAHERAVRRHLAQSAVPAERVHRAVRPEPFVRGTVRWRAPEPPAAIAAIIPSRDNGADLRNAIDSLRSNASAAERLEIVAIDNGSRTPEALAVMAMLKSEAGVSVIAMDEPFNWSRLNNRGVAASEAPLLVFVNDDVTMLTRGWDDCVRGLLARPEIGAVGARLLYPDGTVQHAGILFDWPSSLTIHDGLYESEAAPGPGGRWHLTRAVSAVTGAFLATRRTDFAALGGFDEVELPVAFSDIDYALKLRRAGMKILCTPRIALYHRESKSRGLDRLDPEKRARNAAERAAIERRWGRALAVEPGANPVWHRATLPFRLLSPPSEERLSAYIERCAAENPWRPEDDKAPKSRAVEMFFPTIGGAG